MPQRVVALVLVKQCGQREDDQVIAVCLVEKSAPVVTPKAGYSVPELRMLISCLGDQRSHPGEEKRRIIETVLSSDFECFPRGRQRRDSACADGTVIRHDSENPF